MKDACTILICGDLCPTPDTEAAFTSGDAAWLFHGLLPHLRRADLVMGNLEAPLLDAGTAIVKTGPSRRAATACLQTLHQAGFDLLAMANNHIRDFGDEGVIATLAACRQVGIATVGAGQNAAQANSPALLTVVGWRIAVLAYAEHEFNTAADSQAGANALDLLDSFDEIRSVRAQCDYLIVLYHGGIEHYPFPSPLLQRKCRKMAACGADLVLCQHSHCVGTLEEYDGSTILYGQGNTVFGYRQNAPEWNTGLLVKVDLGAHEPKGKITYLPIQAVASGVDLLPPSDAEQFLALFHRRSLGVRNPEFVASSWKAFCERKRAVLLPILLGRGRLFKFANRRLRNALVNRLYAKKSLRIIGNLIRCEAHHEVVQTLLNGDVPVAQLPAANDISRSVPTSPPASDSR